MSLQKRLAEDAAPTAIAAAAVSSPHPLSFSRIDAIFSAFRYALHQKQASLAAPYFSFFLPSIPYRFAQWLTAIINGIQGAHPVLRLAAAAGLLLGIDDLKSQARASDPNARAPVSESPSAKVQDEAVIALAEVIDLYKQHRDVSEWENEFHSTDSLQSPLTLALIFASRSLPLAAPEKLKVLPLSRLAGLLTSCIIQPFLEVPNESLIPSLSSLSRLASLSLSLLLASRPDQGFPCALDTLNQLRDVSVRAETSIVHILATDPETDAKWLTLKTLLFTTIMLSDSILSASIYIPPTAYSNSSTTPATLAYSILLNLSHLSYLVSQLGGISSVSEVGPDGQTQGSFKEMRRTIYLALDILASASLQDNLAERLVTDLCSSLNSQSTPPALVESKTSYTLSCIEQLVPVLSVQCLKSIVWGIVEPRLYLNSEPTPIQREAFESAHSVVLAVFAVNTNAEMSEQTTAARKNADKDESTLAVFAERLVPFYTRCLLENSNKNLSTPQLCMAFSALVRSASASGTPSLVPTDTNQSISLDLEHEPPSHYALAWYAIEQLLQAIAALQQEHDNNKTDESLSAHLHSLHLTLISCVSAVPLVLLSRLLDEVERVVDTSHRNTNDTEEIFGALHREILEKLGDREIEFAVRWWSAFVLRKECSREMVVKSSDDKDKAVPLARL